MFQSSAFFEPGQLPLQHPVINLEFEEWGVYVNEVMSQYKTDFQFMGKLYE